MKTHAIFIDPTYEVFLDDRLFDVKNKNLNRDDQLLPFARLRENFKMQGIPVHTADKLRDGSERRDINHYWSLGLLGEYKDFVGDDSIRLRGFLLMEPPIVQPKIYAELPRLTEIFEKVYLHNVDGQCYPLIAANKNRLFKLYLPQAHGEVLPEYWERKGRLNKLVAIAGSHNPQRRKPEFYSERIKAVAELNKVKGVDLFGRGWERWWSRNALWWPYWRYRMPLMSSYHGSCISKWDVLSRYRFSLCFENMPMAGYITEKIFDCFYAGTVPVYMGAPDIDKYIPANTFVDMRNFQSYNEMLNYVKSITDENWEEMRLAARDFLIKSGKLEYCDSLLNIIHL